MFLSFGALFGIHDEICRGEKNLAQLLLPLSNLDILSKTFFQVM